MAELGPSRIFPARHGMHRRMARACRRRIAGTGCRRGSQLRGRSAQRSSGFPLGRRRGVALLAAAGAFLFLASAQAQVVSSRIWPARDYTRLTLESKGEVKYTLFAVKDPERLVLDLETEMTPALAELDGKVVPDDPYIKGLRAARNRPGV